MIRELLDRLRQSGKIQSVKMTKTVIEHDASRCVESCALCRQVAEELEKFWKCWNLEQ